MESGKRIKYWLKDNKLVNNRFCDWLDNHTSITRVVIKMFIIYNAFWIGVLIGRYIL